MTYLTLHFLSSQTFPGTYTPVDDARLQHRSGTLSKPDSRESTWLATRNTYWSHSSRSGQIPFRWHIVGWTEYMHSSGQIEVSVASRSTFQPRFSFVPTGPFADFVWFLIFTFASLQILTLNLSSVCLLGRQWWYPRKAKIESERLMKTHSYRHPVFAIESLLGLWPFISRCRNLQLIPFFWSSKPERSIEK